MIVTIASLVAGLTFCVQSQAYDVDWVAFVNSGVYLPEPSWGMFGGYDSISNRTYIIGGIESTNSYFDDDDSWYYYYYYYYNWNNLDNWEYSNRILIHDLSTSSVTESRITAAMSFGSLVSSSVTIDDSIYFMTGTECDIDGISNCKNTTRLHSYNMTTNSFIYDVFGTVPTQDDYDATICWNYNYNNPYIFAFNGNKAFQYVSVDEGDWIVFKNTTVPRRGSVCFFDEITEILWSYGGYAQPNTLETLYFTPNSSSFYMNSWKQKLFMKVDNTYFSRRFVRVDSQLFYFFGGMDYENPYVYYYSYVSVISTATNDYYNTDIYINDYYGLVFMLPVALNNENNDVYLYGGYNGYGGVSRITQSSQNYTYDDDYADGWGHHHHHKKNNTANIVVFSIVGFVILIIVGGYCYKYKVKQKREEVDRMNAITKSLNLNSNNETAESKIMFSDNIDDDDTMYGLLNDNMNNNQKSLENESNINQNTSNNTNNNNIDDNNNIDVDVDQIDKEQLVYMPPNTDNTDPIDNTGDTEEDVIEDIHEE